MATTSCFASARLGLTIATGRAQRHVLTRRARKDCRALGRTSADSSEIRRPEHDGLTIGLPVPARPPRSKGEELIRNCEASMNLWRLNGVTRRDVEEPPGSAPPSLISPDIHGILYCASLAPSGHNAQPWSARLNDGELRIGTERSRWLPKVDPTN